MSVVIARSLSAIIFDKDGLLFLLRIISFGYSARLNYNLLLKNPKGNNKSIFLKNLFHEKSWWGEEGGPSCPSPPSIYIKVYRLPIRGLTKLCVCVWGGGGE